MKTIANNKAVLTYNSDGQNGRPHIVTLKEGYVFDSGLFSMKSSGSFCNGAEFKRANPVTIAKYNTIREL